MHPATATSVSPRIDASVPAARRVIIVTSHFPPSNLASAHRARLLAGHLPEFGWIPTIVTVDGESYEEELDHSLLKVVARPLRVERVRALPTRPIRVVGDVGVRGFAPMLKRILRVIDTEGADFIYVTIPSFFIGPLGRLVHALRGVPYGIDYVDPWVHVWPGSDRRFTKHWMSRKLGELLEPVAVKKASLITGVTEGSYRPVLERNPHLFGQATTEVLPFGGESTDHQTAQYLGLTPYLLDDDSHFRLVYAGTMWDAAQQPLEHVFRSIAKHRAAFEGVRFHFIGTGQSPNNPTPQIQPLAERYGIYGDVVREHPRRIPYLDVLAHLAAADGLFIFGSVKPHYTPSKVYQAVLAKRPILGVLHRESLATATIQSMRAGVVLPFDGEAGLSTIDDALPSTFARFRAFANAYDPLAVDRTELEASSARTIARMLASALDRAVGERQVAV